MVSRIKGKLIFTLLHKMAEEAHGFGKEASFYCRLNKFVCLVSERSIITAALSCRPLPRRCDYSQFNSSQSGTRNFSWGTSPYNDIPVFALRSYIREIANRREKQGFRANIKISIRRTNSRFEIALPRASSQEIVTAVGEICFPAWKSA